MSELPSMFSEITEVGFFEKIKFFVFFWTPKTFLSPTKLIWPYKPHFGGDGGHTSITSKPQLRSKSFRNMTPQKVGFLGLIEIFGAQKVFWGPKKDKKWIFSKNLTSVICLNIKGCSHNGPGHPGTIRTQLSIQKVLTLLWPSVCLYPMILLTLMKVQKQCF